jgi:nucleotidyltransferase/DNA polymerase involved in DNA repair
VVAARTAHPSVRGLEEPCLDAAGFLAPLEVEQLLPALPEHRERLRFLGYRTIGEVAGLPYPALVEQFGTEGRRVLDAAQGKCFEPVRPVYPPDALLERFVFEGATEDLVVLDAGLHALAARLAARLEAKDRCGSQMRVWIERESGAVEERTRRFVHPLRTRMALLAALRALCGGPAKDGEGLIAAVRVRLPGLVRAQRLQPQLHTAQSASPAASAEHALDKVRAVFGDGSVVRGAEVSVPRRVAVLKAWRDVTGWA